ncbi:MAG: NUDIX domain-containing protein [Candidatus Pacearchaeota archaeon]
MQSIEERIIELFLYEKEQKFNEIARQIDIRTNKLSYHIKNLTKKGILEKSAQGTYKLSETAEYLIPYISKRKHTLPVILINIGTKKEAYLIKRQKRPFKNKLALPGGRLQTGESIEEASKGIMKEKFNINIRETKTKQFL